MKIISPFNVEAFDRLMAGNKSDLSIEIPGRINLIGEHTDYNGGQVLPFGIEKRIRITLWKKAAAEFSALGLPDNRTILIVSGTFGQALSTSSGSIAELMRELGGHQKEKSFVSYLPDGIRKSWAAYVVGAFYEVMARDHGLKETFQKDSGIMMKIESDLPQGAGISSSAALSTGLIYTILRAYGKEIDRREIALRAMKIEHRFVGTNCGLMDQLAVLLSEKDHFLRINFRDFPKNEGFSISLIKMHSAFDDYELIALNTGVKHNLSDSPYNERRNACHEVLQMLNDHYGKKHFSLGDYSYDPLFAEFVRDAAIRQRELKQRLVETVLASHPRKDVNASYAAHAIMENHRVDEACRALENGDHNLLDRMMNEGHESLQKDYLVSCSELDLIREEARSFAYEVKKGTIGKIPPIIGGRMTGGGFGGSVIQLVHKSVAPQLVDHFASGRSRYQKETGIIPSIIRTSASYGLHER
ncbi:MAG: hypothetical protein HQK54_18430 [Oligoflexales bacterium]|nr:hypothetical protein [Oligoflexales bacterium]